MYFVKGTGGTGAGICDGGATSAATKYGGATCTAAAVYSICNSIDATGGHSADTYDIIVTTNAAGTMDQITCICRTVRIDGTCIA